MREKCKDFRIFIHDKFHTIIYESDYRRLVSTSEYPSVNTTSMMSLQCAIHVAEIMFEDTI